MNRVSVKDIVNFILDLQRSGKLHDNAKVYYPGRKGEDRVGELRDSTGPTDLRKTGLEIGVDVPIIEDVLGMWVGRVFASAVGARLVPHPNSPLVVNIPEDVSIQCWCLNDTLLVSVIFP